MEKILKTFTLTAPTTATVVRTSDNMASGTLNMPQSQRADFFFRRSTSPAPGPGDIMKGNPKVTSTKKRK